MEGEFLKLRGRKYSVNDIDKLPEELNSFKCTSKETQSALGFFGELNPLSNFYNCEFQYQNLTLMEDNWRMVAKYMCFDGLMEKFTQNPTLVDTLLKTSNKTLVECSFDRIWGNGIPLGDRSCMDRQKWHNVGILGEMLMEIRSQLRTQTTEMGVAPMDTTVSNDNTNE